MFSFENCKISFIEQASTTFSKEDLPESTVVKIYVHALVHLVHDNAFDSFLFSYHFHVFVSYAKLLQRLSLGK